MRTEQLPYTIVNPFNYTSGIYKLTSTLSGHYYYGSTKYFTYCKITHCRYVSGRCYCHFNALIKNIHCNPYMQNVFNKYPSNWVFEVVEYIKPDLVKLKVVEQQYLDEHHGQPLCMNICKKSLGPPARIEQFNPGEAKLQRQKKVIDKMLFYRRELEMRLKVQAESCRRIKRCLNIPLYKAQKIIKLSSFTTFSL